MERRWKVQRGCFAAMGKMWKRRQNQSEVNILRQSRRLYGGCPSKGLDRHRRQKTPHPASSLSHLLPGEKVRDFLRRYRRILLRADALKNPLSLSQGRGWPTEEVG